MPLKTPFTLVPAAAPVTTPTTKFGGRPIWIAPARWPAAPSTGGPMRFLAQLALNDRLFPGGGGMMAYVFFDDAAEPLYGDGFGVVVQAPGRHHGGNVPDDAFLPAATGPTLFALDDERREVPAEFDAVIGPEIDEPVVPLKERYRRRDLDHSAGFAFSRPDLAGNKIGGQPLYIEGLDTPPDTFTDDGLRLLLQLAPERGYWAPGLRRNFLPFHLELGEFGILTVFVSADLTQARVHVQQP